MKLIFQGIKTFFCRMVFTVRQLATGVLQFGVAHHVIGLFFYKDGFDNVLLDKHHTSNFVVYSFQMLVCFGIASNTALRILNV